MLDPNDRETLRVRPCNHAEDIMLLGARAYLRELERFALTEPVRNLRQLMWYDNLGLTLSIEGCRSRSYKILMIIQRIADLSLSCAKHPVVHVVESLGDKSSRRVVNNFWIRISLFLSRVTGRCAGRISHFRQCFFLRRGWWQAKIRTLWQDDS